MQVFMVARVKQILVLIVATLKYFYLKLKDYINTHAHTYLDKTFKMCNIFKKQTKKQKKDVV